MNDDLTTQLSRQLHAQADDWQGAPLTLESVQGKARSIRRTRRAAAGGAVVAAVLAIVVPLGLTQLTPDSQQPPVTNTPTEEPTRAVAPTPRPDGTFPLTLDVPEGQLPDSGYLIPTEKAYVTPEGTQQLPGFYFQLVPYDGGWIGLREASNQQAGSYDVVTLDANLEELSTAPTDSGVVVSPDGSRVAWVENVGNEGDWTVVNAPTDGGEPIRTPTSANTRPVGFLADDIVATEYTLQTTGEVFFNEAGPQGEFDSRVLNGAGDLRPFQWVRASSLTAGLVAGQTEYNGDSTCSEVRDIAAEQVVFPTCDYQLGGFSPDGRWLIGYASYYDYGSPTLAILDSTTGLPVVEFTGDKNTPTSVLSAVWDDNDTILAVVEIEGEQTVLRAEADGSLTRVSDIRPQRDMSIHFSLPSKTFGQN